MHYRGYWLMVTETGISLIDFPQDRGRKLTAEGRGRQTLVLIVGRLNLKMVEAVPGCPMLLLIGNDLDLGWQCW